MPLGTAPDGTISSPRMAANTQPLPDEKHYLVAENVGLVYKAIQELRIPEPWRQDAESDGMLGLVHAARSYDPSSKTRFSVFCYVCIERKMKNTLQRLTNQNKKRVDPSESMDGLETAYHDAQPEEFAPDVPRSLSVFGELAREVDALPAKARFVIKATYAHGWTLERIAKRLGTNSETVRQLRRLALQALKGEPVVWPWDAAKARAEARQAAAEAAAEARVAQAAARAEALAAQAKARAAAKEAAREAARATARERRSEAMRRAWETRRAKGKANG